MSSTGVEGAGASPSLSGDDLEGGGPRWTAVVLAGSRAEGDPLAAHFGLPVKALVSLAGAPMIAHVIRTLVGSPSIARVLIVSQRPVLLDCPELQRLSDRCPVDWAPGRGGIAESLMTVAGTQAAPWPVLVTTADHPLLTPDMVEHFLARIESADLSIAVVAREVLSGRYPQNRRTWLRFRGGAYTGANLFAARTARAVGILKVMARAESSRKSQLKLLWYFGPALALGALTRTMSLRQVVRRLGLRSGLEAKPVILPFAEAGIDVDKLKDWEFAEELLAEKNAKRREGPPLPVSVFDLDRTLTRSGTYTPFLLYAARRRDPRRLLLAPVAGLGFLAHALGVLSRKALKERLQALFMGPKVPRAEVARLAGEFVQRLHFRSEAIHRIESERREGRKIVLATAANGFYAEAIARELGIDEVVCTRSSWDGDDLTPRIAGENCHGREKLAMLQAHFREKGLEGRLLHVRFFSDHASDQPVLSWADEAYVVNPSRRFRTLAAAAGWPVLNWT